MPGVGGEKRLERVYEVDWKNRESEILRLIFVADVYVAFGVAR